jgi:cell division protein FtsL
MTPRRATIDHSPHLKWLTCALTVYVFIAVSGVWIASTAQDVRSLFVSLERNQNEQDALLAEYSRLLIERGTLSSYQNVDQIAERELAMRFPEAVERVLP